MIFARFVSFYTRELLHTTEPNSNGRLFALMLWRAVIAWRLPWNWDLGLRSCLGAERVHNPNSVGVLVHQYLRVSVFDQFDGFMPVQDRLYDPRNEVLCAVYRYGIPGQRCERG
jgi:hypothetical protein